jgi:hypothetical protein
VIHNLKHPITGAKEPYTVARLPSCGEDRVYAKERALIERVRAELAEGRPCVIYCRQTGTRDIQPRLERLIRGHVPEARTFILTQAVDAERREAVIERAIASGTNVVLCNPELVKTGLDLIHFPTLIFYELVFNLSTLMQAAARSYRLNQTHAQCKAYYLYAEGTMEQTAVQLMSRKQRAAKLLTGDIGLTGLDALTEGEGGFEEALLEAIGRDETLLDPAPFFRAEAKVGAVDDEDAAYWNVEAAAEADGRSALAPETDAAVTLIDEPAGLRRVEAVTAYLETVHLMADEREWAARRAELLALLDGGTVDGIAAWLSEHRVVFPGFEREVAAKFVALVGADTTAAPRLRPSRPPAGKRSPEVERPPLGFPEPVCAEPFTQQLALF